MFRVKTPYYDLEFTFRHVHLEPEDEIKAVTTCFVKVFVDGNETIGNFAGAAYCAKGDKFDKATGRKIALTRALLPDVFPKDVRTQVWGVYHGRA